MTFFSITTKAIEIYEDQKCKSVFYSVFRFRQLQAGVDITKNDGNQPYSTQKERFMLYYVIH